VKHWGYGAAAYLFDYLDPVLRKKVVKEFKTSFEELKKFPQIDKKVADPFDFKKLLRKDTKKLPKRLVKQLKKFTKFFDEAVYNVSANLPQIQAAVRKWKWPLTPGDPTIYNRFLMKFDMNYDGRLNPREFILASLWYNKSSVGSPLCKNCYFEIGKVIDAIFLFIDCNNDGLLSAEELWNNLPLLKRNSEQTNIYQFGLDENIRTSAVNDFILKNWKIKEGFLTRTEFRVGILLGFWDRQAGLTKVLEKDERTLKKLRWHENNMIDTALYGFYKKKMAAGLIK